MIWTSEATLILEARAGCPRAKEEVLRLYGDLSWHIVHKLRGLANYVELEDLYLEGIIGLYKAVDMFDTKKGVKFSTYAVYHIYATIKRFVEEHDRLITRPVYLGERSHKVLRAVETYYAKKGFDPEPEEVSSITGVPIKWVERIMGDPGDILSFDQKYGDFEDLTFGEMIPTPERHENNTELLLILEEALDYIDEKERKIIIDNYWRDKNFREIGDELGVSRERTRQVAAAALEHLKEEIMATTPSIRISPTPDELYIQLIGR